MTAEHTRGTPTTDLDVVAFQRYRSSVIAKEDRLNAEITRLRELSQQLALDNAKLRAAVVEDAGPVIVGLGQEIQAQRVDLERLRGELGIWQQRFGDCQATVSKQAADLGLMHDRWDASVVEAAADMRQEEVERLQATLLRMEAVVIAARKAHAVTGHNSRWWAECTADPPESCPWVQMGAALDALDAVPRRDRAELPEIEPLPYLSEPAASPEPTAP